MSWRDGGTRETDVRNRALRAASDSAAQAHQGLNEQIFGLIKQISGRAQRDQEAQSLINAPPARENHDHQVLPQVPRGLLALAGVPAVTFGPPGTGAADAGGASDDRSRDALERRRRYRARLHYRLLQHHSREMAAGESYWAAALNLSNYRSSQADITDDSGAGGLAGFGRIAPGGGGGGEPAPRRPPIFPVTLFAVTIALAVGGGALYWHQGRMVGKVWQMRPRSQTA